jgi:hypothetical protein
MLRSLKPDGCVVYKGSVLGGWLVRIDREMQATSLDNDCRNPTLAGKNAIRQQMAVFDRNAGLNAESID